jgi:hypothetical protein
MSLPVDVCIVTIQFCLKLEKSSRILKVQISNSLLAARKLRVNVAWFAGHGELCFKLKCVSPPPYTTCQRGEWAEGGGRGLLAC